MPAAGLAELQRDLANFQRLVELALEREMAAILREAANVARRRTPVRTGETRRSIKSAARVRGGGVVDGAIWVDGPAEQWIAALERRHGMFRAADAHIRRSITPRLRAALNRIAAQTFGRRG